MEPLYTAQEMRDTDRWAIAERGIPSLDLMERAGRGLADVVARAIPDGPVVVVCGTGNNGGDGFVAARLLHEAGREVRVVLAGDRAKVAGDAAENLRRLTVAVQPWDPACLDGAAGAVDALLGTGFAGEVRGTVGEAVRALAASGLPVVAADVPSGVDATTGEVAGPAVRAVATATFHGAKPGLWVAPGKRHAGAVHVIPIGIPDGGPAAPSAGLIGEDALAGVPRRGAESTKFSSGHVLVCGGSRGLTGAPSMAAEAAMRAGAGYVSVAVPASLNAVFEVRLLEVMSLPLPDADGALTADGADAVLAEAGRRGGALVVGPGFGRAEPAQALARRLAAEAPVPLVLDADGLNAHAGRLDALASRPAPAVLTPHAGELGRLLEAESAEIGRRRLWFAREAARRSGAVVVLKGDDTLVATPDGRVGVSRGDAPALATAGTGDVLSGVVAAMLARGLDPFAAACAGVELHRRAGRLAAVRVGAADGVVASDVIAALPRAWTAGA
ncbi:MAG: NAD(P)H-hydrate dehydratase [Solirubrobacteraceae bacterium]|nr:NAD(P)H-hydrate dehydratase [Solirubrobacteraceae bacterium]